MIAYKDIFSDNFSLYFAKLYLNAGYNPTPIKPRSKKPFYDEWQNIRLTRDELAANFLPGTNVGVVLGDPSGGLVDVDLDNANAVKLAPYFLPPTDFKFGRQSKPASHWIYQTQNPGRCKKLRTHETIVEVRANGGQTVFPGSFHDETGEEIYFCDADIDKLPAPTQTTREYLDAAARNIAIGSVSVDHWTPGLRHQLSLALAGVFVRHRWTEDDVLKLVKAVAGTAKDDDVEDRLNSVRTTFENCRKGNLITGWPTLNEAIGADAAKYIEKFLGPTRGHFDQTARPAANSNCQWTLTNFATDHDAAVTFSEQCSGTLIFSPISNQWYQRNVQVYEPIADCIAQGAVGDFADMAHRQLGKDVKTVKSRSKINAILELSRSRLAVDQALIDSDTNLVGLCDGRILDLMTGETVATNRDVMVTKKLGTTQTPDALCPRWLQFLDTIFEGNQEIIDFVQRAVGYSLSGEVTEQCFFIMTGTGANGKSTFIHALGKMFGDYSGITPMQTLTVMPFSNGQTNDLAAMEGKRFIAASDGEAGQRLAEAKIKHMTGGDTICCRGMYKDFKEYDPQFKLWLATNDLPNVTGSDNAIWRRIMVIKFPVTIPEELRDRDLSTKLAAEAAGIFNWALQGYRAWKTGGLKPPSEVTEATQTYRCENDLIGQFIEDRCVQDPAAKSTTKVLHVGYSQWCEENRYAVLPLIPFAKEIKKKGFASRKFQRGNGFAGIDLKPAHKFENSNGGLFE
jgi:putative DNA primase/helicase